MYTDDTLEIPSEGEREEVPDLPKTSETGQPHAVAVAKRLAFSSWRNRPIMTSSTEGQSRSKLEGMATSMEVV